MKVCIPCTHSDSEQGELHVSYSDAPFFAFWDSTTGRFEFKRNPLAGKEDACICGITRWIRKLGAQVFITADIGRRAAARLVRSGVETLTASAGDLGSILQQYQSGHLVAAPTGEPVKHCHDHAHEENSQVQTKKCHGQCGGGQARSNCGCHA
jgi:predicted Fe-Mo cluster-binding NifX family protein